MVQIFTVDVPAVIFYNFMSGGLMWLWNELAQEVYALAEADGVQEDMEEIHEEHIPQVTPNDFIAPGDGEAGLVNDDGFGEGL